MLWLFITLINAVVTAATNNTSMAVANGTFDESSDNDLKPGEIAGIVIGAFAALLLLFIVVAMCTHGPPSTNKYVKI